MTFSFGWWLAASVICLNVTARCSYEFIRLFDRAMRFQSKTHISPGHITLARVSSISVVRASG